MSDSVIRTLLGRFASLGGAVRAVSVPHNVAVARGEVPGAERLEIWGWNGNANTLQVSLFPVWYNMPTYSWPTADQTLKVSSTSTDDDVGGTGATAVRVWYLDSAGAEHTVDSDTDGTVLVTSTATTARRVNRAEVLSVGAAGRNVGRITIWATNGTTPLCHILPGLGVSTQAIQTVPAGKVDVLRRFGFMDSYSVQLTQVLVRASSTSVWECWKFANVQLSVPRCETEGPLVIPAGSDYYAIAYPGSAGQTIVALMTGFRADA